MLLPQNTEMIQRVAERLRALADESRIRILLTLKAGPQNVGELAQSLGIRQASVSKHLAILKAAGILECSRVGTQAIYRVADLAVFEMCTLVCDGVVRHLEAQRAVLESHRWNSRPPHSPAALPPRRRRNTFSTPKNEPTH